jgi:DNA-binding PadR family transcriptional regulator
MMLSEPRRRPDEHLPLTPVAFEILLALAAGALHGYAILQDIDARTGGRLSLHAGTLYRALARLAEAGLLEELEGRPDAGVDERRRYYRLTRLGRRVAAAEAARLERQVGVARARALLGGGVS